MSSTIEQPGRRTQRPHVPSHTTAGTTPRPRRRHRGSPTALELESLRERLSAQADLFDDPGAYLAGVEDAIDRLRGTDIDRVRGTELGPTPTVAPWEVAPYRATVDGGPGSRSERARYLAALSIGLATAGRDHREVIRELMDTANGCSDLLQQAARCVYALRVGEAEHRRTAETLLLRAATEAGPTPN